MRRRLTESRMFVFSFLAVLACATGPVLLAQSSAGAYSSGDSQITRKAPRSLLPDGNYGVGPYRLFQPTLEEGEGRREVTANCNTCHSLRYITMQPPLPADAWAVEVTKMVKTFGASIPDDTGQKIIQYLQSHYAPNKRQH